MLVVDVPATRDCIQEYQGTISDVPEIRVWCSPYRMGRQGDAYYCTFTSFSDALDFARTHPEAEPYPLVAFRGYELDLFRLPPLDRRTERIHGGNGS